MKRIQLSLFAIILLSIAAKVSFTTVEKVNYAALSTETKLEHVQQFYQYKVNHIQSGNPYRIKSCMIQTAVCCHT